MQIANNIHENIKIELRWSRSCIEFLDILVKLENGHIYTDLYSKPTDKHLYLRENSCHPPHTKKSLAYGLGTTGQSKNYRLKVEDKWIQQLETRVPTGCNVKMNI